MKTKQIFMVTLLLLGVSLGRQAQAFYNPSAGRWLSRDPIGERGGLNTYAFVSNDALNRWDKLGLDAALFSCLPGTCCSQTSGQSPSGGSTDCGIFSTLVQRWRSGNGWTYRVPEDAVERMMGRGQNVKDIEQIKRMLKQKCRNPGKGAMEQVVAESFDSAGAEFEAWYLGGHQRILSGYLDCCCKRGKRWTPKLRPEVKLDFSRTAQCEKEQIHETKTQTV